MLCLSHMHIFPYLSSVYFGGVLCTLYSLCPGCCGDFVAVNSDHWGGRGLPPPVVGVAALRGATLLGVARKGLFPALFRVLRFPGECLAASAFFAAAAGGGAFVGLRWVGLCPSLCVLLCPAWCFAESRR